MITLTIDGIEVTVERGTSILDAAEKAGVRIPTLCHDKRLIPFGACRMCVVELKGRRGLTPACFNPVRNGMEVLTQTPSAREARRLQLQLILRHHPLDCPVCEAGGACDLQNLVFEYGVEDLPFSREKSEAAVDRSSHFIKRDMTRCILCGCCVRICNEVQGVNELSFVNRGIRTEIGTDFGRPLNCEFCGQCVSACPVGAMVLKPLGPMARAWEVARTQTTCSFCGLGCTLELETKGGHIARVSSRYDLGSNEGNLCVKGRFGWPYVQSDARLNKPLVREGDRLVETSWEKALQRVAEGLQSIRKESGGQALAVLGSARLTNEEGYALQRLARAVLGTPNLDHGAGLSYLGLMEGMRPVLGYAAATNPVRDIGDADVILAVSGNFKETHPVAKNHVVLASGRRRARVIVVDHVHTSLCDLVGAEAIFVRPGTEGLLLRGMIRVILEEDLWDRALVEERAEGLDAARDAVTSLSLDGVAAQTGATVEQIQDAARAIAQAPKGCILMALDTLTVGDPADVARAASVLAVLAGKVGKPGCGLHVYGEKANSQGALDMGLLPGFLPGYRAVEDAQARALFEEAWATSLPPKAGLGAKSILEGCADGSVRGLYVVGENPVGTYPERDRVEDALRKVGFLVVQDLFLSETAKLAHVVLPVASFAEKDGTFTSVDRRVQRVNKALALQPDLRTDLEVFCAMARIMGSPLPYSGPADVLDEIGKMVPMYQSITWDRTPGIPWPFHGDGEVQGTPVLYAESFPHGKAQLRLETWKEIGPGGDAKDYPWVLHPQTRWFHSGTFSTWSPSLMEVCPGAIVLLHWQDAGELGIKEGDSVRVVSPRGEIVGPVQIRFRGVRGVVQIPHHFSVQPVNKLLGWGAGAVGVRVERA
jgi:formate dehydrogenase (NADP+) alpha subunit